MKEGLGLWNRVEVEAMVSLSVVRSKQPYSCGQHGLLMAFVFCGIGAAGAAGCPARV